MPDITVTITSTSTTALSPFNFTITATAENATEINQTITGSFEVRQALVQVTSVTTSTRRLPSRGNCRRAAQILNAVNTQQQAKVFFTVTDPANTVLFTSRPVSTMLNVLTTLSTVDLGNLVTTGFALGQDTITVTVTDSSGNPIPGGVGTGSILIGTPVTATLSTTPTSLPPGTGTVTTTLQLASQTSYGSPLSLAGVAAISGSSGVAVNGTLAYTGANSGIDVVDVSDPTMPKVLSTFGTSDFPGMTVEALQVYNSELIVLAQSGGSQNQQSLLIYSLATPSSPTLLGQAPITVNGSIESRLAPFTISNNHVYISAFWYRYDTGSGQILNQFGESINVDITDPAHPAVASVIYNDPPDPSTGYPDGTSNVWQGAPVNNNVLLLASTTATGSDEGSNAQGLVMVVDTSNPASPSVIEKLVIPGMGGVTGISVQGNRAFVLGSSEYWGSGTTGLAGNVVVAMLDLSQPTNPTIISTQTLNVPSIGISFVQSLGNNMYVTGSLAGQAAKPELLVFDASDPQNVAVTQVGTAVLAGSFTAAGNLLYTVDGSSLSIYNIVTGQDTPVVAQVTVPAGVSTVPSSFSLAPTSTTTNADGSQTLAWDLAFSAGSTSQSIIWQSTVTGLQPSQSVTVATGATVQFTSGLPARLSALDLPDQVVTGEEIIGITPATQTVAPESPASYQVSLANPTGSPVTYSLSVQGVPAGWINLESSVTVGANQTVSVPLVLTSPAFATGSSSFTVSASGDNGASSSVGYEPGVAGASRRRLIPIRTGGCDPQLTAGHGRGRHVGRVHADGHHVGKRRRLVFAGRLGAAARRDRDLERNLAGCPARGEQFPRRDPDSVRPTRYGAWQLSVYHHRGLVEQFGCQQHDFRLAQRGGAGRPRHAWSERRRARSQLRGDGDQHRRRQRYVRPRSGRSGRDGIDARNDPGDARPWRLSSRADQDRCRRLRPAGITSARRYGDVDDEFSRAKLRNRQPDDPGHSVRRCFVQPGEPDRPKRGHGHVHPDGS